MRTCIGYFWIAIKGAFSSTIWFSYSMYQLMLCSTQKQWLSTQTCFQTLIALEVQVLRSLWLRGHNVCCEQLWTAVNAVCRACQTHRRTPHHTHNHAVCAACIPTVIPNDANTRYQPNIDCSAPALSTQIWILMSVSYLLHLRASQWAVCFYFVIWSCHPSVKLIPDQHVWCSNIDLLPDQSAW